MCGYTHKKDLAEDYNERVKTAMNRDKDQWGTCDVCGVEADWQARSPWDGQVMTAACLRHLAEVQEATILNPVWLAEEVNRIPMRTLKIVGGVQ